MTDEPANKSVRPDGKTVVTERVFRRVAGDPENKPPANYTESQDMPGVHMSPQYLEHMRVMLGEKAAELPKELSPDVKALAEELAVVHLPEMVNETGRKIGEPSRFELLNSVRVAKYLVDRGIRIHPELEQVRWLPTPSGGPHDMGLHVTRDEDGNWPAPDPEEFYDLDKIVVAQSETGWDAAHPCGIEASGASKIEAHSEVVQQLMVKIKEAHDG